MEKIYIKCGRQKTVREFIQKAFIETNQLKQLRVDITYRDPECTIVQCNHSKYRTIGAIHALIKTYYPSYTIEKTLKALCQPFLYEERFLYPNFMSCDTVKNITFSYYPATNSIYNDKPYSETIVEGKKLIDVAKELDLNTDEKLEKHIKDEYNKLNKP